MAAIPKGQLIVVPLEALVDCALFDDGQPRTTYGDAELQELADSIQHQGLLEPLSVRPHPDRAGIYEVLGGHRRRRACALAEVPVLVRDLDDDAAREVVLVDNLHREDFLPWEEGRGYAELMRRGYSVAAIQQKTSKAEATIRNKMAVASIGERLQEWYVVGDLTEHALRALADLPDKVLSPKRCPACNGVNAEDAQECRNEACQCNLSDVLAFPAGNPQEAAARLCRGKQNGQIVEVVRAVQESYGLCDQVVQTSLGFNDLQVTEEAVEVKHKLARMLEQVGSVGVWLCRPGNRESVAEATVTQRAAILSQVEAARAVLSAVEREVQKGIEQDAEEVKRAVRQAAA